MALNVWLPLAVVLCAASIAAVTDVWKYRVYNALTLPLFLSGMVYQAVCGGWESLGSGLLGASFGFLALILPYLMGVMGAGDVKLFAGVGARLGYPITIKVFVVSVFVAGIYAAVLIIWRDNGKNIAVSRVLFHRLTALGTYFGKDDLLETAESQRDRRYRVIPFGAMVPLGVIGAAIWQTWFA